MPISRLGFSVSGPLFDGRADRAVYDLLDAIKKDVAETGRDWIKTDAEGMDKSGRGGTGRAAAHVGAVRVGAFNDWRIRGDSRQGETWWPWLEGTSKRNEKTRFKGYHTFRSNRNKLRRHWPEIARHLLPKYLPLMGGHAE